MITIPGVKLEAVFGAVPASVTDNLSALTAAFGADRAAAIVSKTGFTVRRTVRSGVSVVDLVLPAARKALEGVASTDIGGVVFVTFTAPNRYPAAAMEVRQRLDLPADIPAFDLSLACSGYPYGLLVAVQLAAASRRKVLLLDGDIQSAWLDASDSATAAVMGDGASATLVSANGVGTAVFGFLNRSDGADALICPAAGPVRMRGFDVFRFVMTDTARFLKKFLSDTGGAPDLFVPHQANLYMIRQLASSVDAEKALLVSGDRYGNPGSASVPLTLAAADGALYEKDTVLAGFGAGLSAAAVRLKLPVDFRHGVTEV